MNRTRGLALTLAAALAAPLAAPAQSNVQFSGLAVQSGPDGRAREAKIFVGDSQVRLEHARQGQSMVEIYDLKNKRTLLVVPDQKIYMQRAIDNVAIGNPMLPPQDSNPCSFVAEATCNKLGTETLYGRPVSQWEMQVVRDGKPLNSLHWIDDQRHMSLRDVWPDGSTTAFVLQGEETLHGRAVERWQRTTTRADGETVTSTQWYDPQLQIAIREELPDGYFREIRDIQVGPQAAGLFRAPPGFQRVDIDQQGAPSQGPPDKTDLR